MLQLKDKRHVLNVQLARCALILHKALLLVQIAMQLMEFMGTRQLLDQQAAIKYIPLALQVITNGQFLAKFKLYVLKAMHVPTALLNQFSVQEVIIQMRVQLLVQLAKLAICALLLINQ